MLLSKRITTLCLTVVVVALCLTTSRAQTQPKFSSAYTDLKRECRSPLTRKEEKEAEERGSDIPILCKGYGGYAIYIYYSAMASQIAITRPTKADRIGDPDTLALQGLNYDQEGRKVEWRLADGKPFAVILRVSNYSEKAAENGGNPFDPKFKTGESLLVKGLKGYEHIDFTVDTKTTPNPNVKARELADSNYKKQ
jgi:hypothetical protein